MEHDNHARLRRSSTVGREANRGTGVRARAARLRRMKSEKPHSRADLEESLAIGNRAEGK